MHRLQTSHLQLYLPTPVTPWFLRTDRGDLSPPWNVYQHPHQITVLVNSNTWDELVGWESLFETFNPKELHIIKLDSDPSDWRVPTSLEVFSGFRELRMGTEIDLISFQGPSSIPVARSTIRDRAIRGHWLNEFGRMELFLSPIKSEPSRVGQRGGEWFKLSFKRADGTSGTFKRATESSVAQWLAATELLGDDQIVWLGLRRG